MRTREQYLADLKKMRPNIYMDGKLVGRDDPRILHASRAIQMTFALAENPEYEEPPPPHPI